MASSVPNVTLVCRVLIVGCLGVRLVGRFAGLLHLVLGLPLIYLVGVIQSSGCCFWGLFCNSSAFGADCRLSSAIQLLYLVVFACMGGFISTIHVVVFHKIVAI